MKILKYILGARKVRKQISVVNKKINGFSKEIAKIEKRRRRNLRELQARGEELNLVRRTVEEAEARLRETVDEAKSIHRKHAEALEAARSQLKIMEEVTVPALIQQGQVLLEMWKEETSIHVMRQVAVRPTEMEDM